jgi:hypothetical protein
MGGPRRPRGEELQRRIEAWGDQWRAAAGSTEPADRDRAEAAIRLLYRTHGRAAPDFQWVPSPVAGILAYQFIALVREPVRGRWARGEIGNGANQPFHALAVPFDMEPAWVRRTVTGVRDRLPAASGDRPTGDPFRDAGRRLGLGGTAITWELVRAAAEAGAREPDLAFREPDPRAADAAPLVLGDAWPRLVALTGEPVARGIFVTAVRRLVRAVVVDSRHRPGALQAMQPGQWDGVTPLMAAARDVLGGTLWRHRDGRAVHETLVDERLEIARACGPWWAMDGMAIVSERPLVQRRDDRARLHAPDGPALAWPDGTELFAWHGVRVPREVVMAPQAITVEQIDRETNAEVRRVLVERFGPERLVREGGATLVHEDETGRLWRRDLERSQYAWRPVREEPLLMVEVVNRTPEPDGSSRTYWLRVPPTMRTARDAVAWTFGMAGGSWRPEAES